MHFPRSCLHCDEPACVTVCPTGASYKRAEDGIVLVNEDLCIGCKLCSWACPYGAREYDYDAGVMKKCTLCIDRIYNENLAAEERVPACVATCPTSARHFGDLGDPNSDVSKLVRERGGYDLMPEMGYKPVNRYLPPRPRRTEAADTRRRRTIAAIVHRYRRRLARLDRPPLVELTSSCIPHSQSSYSRRCAAPAMACWPGLGFTAPSACCRSIPCSARCRCCSRSESSVPGSCPRRFISAIRSGHGERSRNGVRPGCRARAWPRWRRIFPASRLASAGSCLRRLPGRGR